MGRGHCAQPGATGVAGEVGVSSRKGTTQQARSSEGLVRHDAYDTGGGAEFNQDRRGFPAARGSIHLSKFQSLGGVARNRRQRVSLDTCPFPDSCRFVELQAGVYNPALGNGISLLTMA